MMSQNQHSKFRYSVPQKRFGLWLPELLYNRLAEESVLYGVPKSHIVKEALLSYYRSIDAKFID